MVSDAVLEAHLILSGPHKYYTALNHVPALIYSKCPSLALIFKSHLVLSCREVLELYSYFKRYRHTFCCSPGVWVSLVRETSLEAIISGNSW